MKLIPLIITVALATGGCEQTFNLESPAAPSAPNTTNITNTNTNTNTNNNQPDRTGSDTGTPTPPSGGGGVDLPLPAYGEATVANLGISDADALSKSCQLVYGESAWTWLDKVITTLQQRDGRWGYMCRNNDCSEFGRDIVAYKAGNTNLGIWIVDVIGNHCPNPNDIVTATWQTLPFETVRQWRFSRK